MTEQEFRANALQLGMQIAVADDLKKAIQGKNTQGVLILTEAISNAERILPQIRAFIDPA